MSHLTFNDYRILWDLTSNKPFLTGFPIHLDIELTSKCNLKCAYCVQQLIRQKKSHMPFEDFKSIIDEGAENSLCSVKLQSRGESVLHPYLTDCVSYAHKKNILDIHITTNALLLNSKKIKELVQAGLNLIILSFDDHHAQECKMSKDEYIKFLQNVVNQFDKARKINKRSNIKIRVQSSIPEFTTESIKKHEKQNKQLFPAADLILINAMYSAGDGQQAIKNLAEFEQYPCAYLWQRLTIFSDLRVTTCIRDYNCDYNFIGSLKDNSIKDLWHSPKLNSYRRMHLQGKREEMCLCRNCELYTIHKKTGKPGSCIQDFYKDGNFKK